MRQLELHPLCTLFPRLGETEFRALCDDIAANGLREPITTHDGMILDGGNRYRACLEVGVTPRFVAFKGPSLAAFVLSANLHRRHMSAGQQAAIVATVQDWAKAQPSGKGGDRRSSATLHLDSAANRAAESGASLRTQKMADKVAKQAPELARKVAHGEISLPKAHEQLAPRPEPKAAKAPTLESLLADNTRLREELAAEIAAHEETRHREREMADIAESYLSMEKGEHEMVKEMAKLRGLMRTVETQRDQWMTTANELKKTVKSLQRQVAALERKAA